MRWFVVRIASWWNKGARLKSALPFDVLRSRWYNLYLNPAVKRMC
jgi:hypothetical protein